MDNYTTVCYFLQWPNAYVACCWFSYFDDRAERNDLYLQKFSINQILDCKYTAVWTLHVDIRVHITGEN